MHTTASTAVLVPLSNVPSVKMLALGGKHISPALAEKWLQCSNTSLMSTYGPTECSITECFITSTANALLRDKEDVAVIGRALADTQTWVVGPHRHNRLAPIGAIQELLVEGLYLGRGYLNDLIKTATYFITDPSFVAQVSPKRRGRRMYCTCGLVRYTRDGSLSIPGRCDSQVKIKKYSRSASKIVSKTWLVISFGEAAK